MTKKEIFLKSLRGKKNKYKRYGGSPLRYAGGKSLAVGYILEHLPDDADLVVSPFLGGGSVEIAMANELGIKVLGFDINSMLSSYWYDQLRSPKDLYNFLSSYSPTKETYNRIKQDLIEQDAADSYLGWIELSAKYFFNFNLSYGPNEMGWTSNIYLNKCRYSRMIERVRDFRCPNLHTSCEDFEVTLLRYPKEFLFCDPPYYLNGDSKLFKGIYPSRNNPIYHKNFNHKLLRDLLYKHRGGFILCYNDCTQIREWYKDFEIVEVSWQYTMGQGETRIGKNRLENGTNHVKNSSEILILKK